MGIEKDNGGSRWVARYEVAVDPATYPHVHALLQQKGAFAEDFSQNLERLAHEYLSAVEQHLSQAATDSRAVKEEDDSPRSSPVAE